MKKGLTLIEVILAVAILGTALTVLLTGAARCLAVMKTAKHYQTAQWALGMGEVEYPLEVEEDIEDLVVEGETYLDKFSFSREVEDDDDEDGLYVVRTRITWARRGGEGYEEVLRYFYYPEEE